MTFALGALCGAAVVALLVIGVVIYATLTFTIH